MPVTEKAAKKTLRKAAPKPEFNWFRPVRLSLSAVFEKGSRKVVPAHLEAARAAAEAAFRSTLESYRPDYKIGEIKSEVEYSYVLARSSN